MQSPCSENNSPGRFQALDGLRGWAAVVVVIFHCVLPFGGAHFRSVLSTPIGALPAVDHPLKLLLFAVNGQTAVVFFFILSGAVLYRSLLRDGVGLRRSIAFALQRALRIYPALIVSVLASAAMFAVLAVLWPERFGAPDALTVIGDMLLLSSRTIGSAHTLQVEMVAIPFMLAAAAAMQWHRVVGALLPVAAGIWFLYARPPFGPPAFNQFLLLFMAGFTVTMPIGRSVARLTAPAWPLVLGVFAYYRAFTWSDSTSLLVQATAGWMLVCIVAHGDRTVLSLALRSRLSQLLGRISYSFYLLNVPLLTVFVLAAATWPVSKAAPVVTGLAGSLIVVLATIPLAILSEHFIERPGIAAGRRVRAMLVRWREDSILAPAE